MDVLEGGYRHEIDARFDGCRAYVLRVSGIIRGVSEDRRGGIDTYYVDNVVAKIDSGVGAGAIVDETGVTRNVKGEGAFHDMSVHCLYHMTSVGETMHFNGSCVHTDKDGDNIFGTFDDKTTTLMGGTGKYKGITGTISYTMRELHDAVGGRPALIANHKAKWEIK